jgi:hypothetical protein
VQSECIDKIPSIIEGNHNPTDLSFIAHSKVTNSIDEDIALLRDLFYHLLKLPFAVDQLQVGQIGIGSDAIASHDEMLVVVTEIVTVIIDRAHLLLSRTAEEKGVIVVLTVLRFYGHE